MEAIRGFKKKELQKPGEREVKRKKKQHEDVTDISGKAMSGAAGDFMSDLAKQLSLRRKGISGAGKTGTGNEGTEANSGRRAQNPMDRLSTLIPPPPLQPTVDCTNSHEDDWGDS